MNQFENISPLDYRYRVPELEPFLTEEASIQYQIKVEIALVKILALWGICSPEIYEEVLREAPKITAREVYKEDAKTKHSLRALVNCIQKRVSKKARPFIHLTATSSDIYDTANALRLRDASREILIPYLIKFEQQLIALALAEKDTFQVGRTHGQHAVPITFGFAIAEYVSRLGNMILQVISATENLRGKFSGATGSYNALALLVGEHTRLENKPARFEVEVLRELGLTSATHSTQIVEPEFLTNHTHALVTTSGVIANFVRDMRQLQRTEIGEISEGFGSTQVGSSTMPHKRNPVTFEHVEGLWKELMPRMMTLYLDQISEHQRDLSNYSSGRFVFEICDGLVVALKRLHETMDTLVVDRERMLENFRFSRETAIAEPLYILLAHAGHPNAHEAVKKLTIKAEKTGKTILDLLSADRMLKPYWIKIPEEKKGILSTFEQYIGIAPQKTADVCLYWKYQMASYTRIS